MLLAGISNSLEMELEKNPAQNLEIFKSANS